MSYETVLLDRQEGVGRITMNRPDNLNALDDTLLREIFDAVEACRVDDAVRAVVFTGAGRGFCSGADIGGKGEVQAGKGIERYNRIIRALRGIEKPVVCGLNGAAAGAGVGLALACDFRVASDRAKFATAFLRVGLSADSGVAYHLPKIVGMQKATELLFNPRVVGADELLSLGLVNEVVPSDAFEARLAEVAAGYAKGPTRALGLTKRILNNSWELPLAHHLDFEAHAQGLTGGSVDFQEGVLAFQEKRDPRFQGR